VFAGRSRGPQLKKGHPVQEGEKAGNGTNSSDVSHKKTRKGEDNVRTIEGKDQTSPRSGGRKKGGPDRGQIS